MCTIATIQDLGMETVITHHHMLKKMVFARGANGKAVRNDIPKDEHHQPQMRCTNEAVKGKGFHTVGKEVEV